MEMHFKDKAEFLKIKIEFYLKNPKKFAHWFYENLQTSEGLEKPETLLQIILNFINPLPALYLIIYDSKIKSKIIFEKKARRIPEKARIYPTYFSYGKHFEYLFLSLKSLEKLNS